MPDSIEKNETSDNLEARTNDRNESSEGSDESQANTTGFETTPMPRFLPLWIDPGDSNPDEQSEPDQSQQADSGYGSSGTGETGAADLSKDAATPSADLQKEGHQEESLEPVEASDTSADQDKSSTQPEKEPGVDSKELSSPEKHLSEPVPTLLQHSPIDDGSDLASDEADATSRTDEGKTDAKHVNPENHSEPAPLRDASEGERYVKQISESDHIVLAKIISKKLAKNPER